MISGDCIKDILDADDARRQVDKPALLTPVGKIFFMQLLVEMEKLKLTLITKSIIEESP